MKTLLFFLLFLSSAPLFAASAGGFLFVTFRGEADLMGEQVYLGTSPDGRTWDTVNSGKPYLISNLGEKGVRDPFILRSRDGKKAWILATDLSIASNRSWERAVTRGSKSIVVWESTDLAHWSPPRLVQIAADDAGCTWAPEAVFDEDTQDYLVFWASKNAFDHFRKQRIWACRTKDFQTFGKPFIYIDRANDVIDTDIIRNRGRYFRFSKDEKEKAITMETSLKLMGPWTEVAGSNVNTLRGYEGPACFLVEAARAGKPETWCLMLDYYSRGTGYQPFLTHDLAAGQFTPGTGISFPFQFRHGSMLPITAAEMARLKAASAP